MKTPKVEPRRVVLSRRKGFRLRSSNKLPIVKVDRSTKWGNPFKTSEYGQEDSVRRYRTWAMLSHQRDWRALVRFELAGKNLACWCKVEPIDEVDLCHASVLLEIANSESDEVLHGTIEYDFSLACRMLQMSAATGDCCHISGKEAKLIHTRLCRLNTIENHLRAGLVQTAVALAQQPQ